VFSNPEALAKLETIVHPVVGQAVATLVGRSTQPVAVIEAIKLLEGDLGKAVDEIWVVNASPETQYKRLTGPRKMPEAEARQRIGAQNAQTDKLAQATVVINNDGNVEETWKQVQAAYANVLKKAAGAAPAAPAQAAVPVAPPPAPQQAAAPPVSAPPPAPAQAVAPAQPQPVPEQPTASVDIPSDVQVIVKRGMPSHAELIAKFIGDASGTPVDRMDVMMSFGQKSYLLAQDSTERVLAVMGWQVENLITRVDEFYLAPGAPSAAVVDALVVAVEAASKDLQSEVAYVFLSGNSQPEAVQTFARNGYEVTTVDQIKIPAWREAVQEMVSSNKAAQILNKRLREDRVLKPI
jgi:dephospho-CoA kinase